MTKSPDLTVMRTPVKNLRIHATGVLAINSIQSIDGPIQSRETVPLNIKVLTV
jgi:hypothetical protein